MKKLIFILLTCMLHVAKAQQTCFDDANEYRFSKLQESVDSLLVSMKKSQNMIIGCQMPNDSFVTIQGTKKHMANYIGKPLIINFWYIYCPPCINEIPSFNELSKKYGDKINIVAMAKDEKKQIEEFLSKHIFTAEMVSDAEDYITKRNVGSGYPFVMVIDQTGKIVSVKSGGKTTPDSKMDLFKAVSPLIDAMLTNKKN